MKTRTFDYKFIVIGATMLFASGSAALAGDSASNTRVTTEGPYTISQEASTFGARPDVTISRAVSYSDLDLTTGSGVDTLKGRVQEAARDVCNQIDRRYSQTGSDRMTCIRNASTQALGKVNVIVASLGHAQQVAALH